MINEILEYWIEYKEFVKTEAVKTSEQAKKLPQGWGISYYPAESFEGFMDWLLKEKCTHPEEAVVSEMSEYEHWAGCMRCGKRLD